MEKFRIRIVFVLVGHLGEDLIMMEKYISLVFFLRRLYWEDIFLIPLEDVLVIDRSPKAEDCVQIKLSDRE